MADTFEQWAKDAIAGMEADVERCEHPESKRELQEAITRFKRGLEFEGGVSS